MSVTIYEYDRGHRVERLVRAKIRNKSRYWSIDKYGRNEALQLATDWHQNEVELLRQTNNLVRPKTPNKMNFDDLTIISDRRLPKSLVARIRYRDASGKLKTTSMSLSKYTVGDVAVEYMYIVGCYANTRGQFDCVIPSKHKIIKALNKELQERKKHVP